MLLSLKKSVSALLGIALIGLLPFVGGLTSSCSRPPAGEQTAEQLEKKGKSRPKKCKHDNCYVRMTHKHDGGDYKGKRGGFFMRLFTPKESKYGQGRYRNHYDKKKKR
jgi:hypothetical protein